MEKKKKKKKKKKIGPGFGSFGPRSDPKMEKKTSF